MTDKLKLSWWDRFLIGIAPQWGLRRVHARAKLQLMGRHFEAASVGRRTSGWHRLLTDANTAAGGGQLGNLRAQARDLVRNNPWARRGLRRIVTDTVGWGIRPKATGSDAELLQQRWKQWAETTECDANGRHTFYGLQKLVMRTVVESGEVLIRRRFRLPTDGLSVPMQLQVLEPDYIDTSRDNIEGLTQGSRIVQGVEFDVIGRRVAYWLFDRHPGSGQLGHPISKRIPADGILHVFEDERPGQVRGPSWFASVDVRLHDFDEYEDATLLKQKIAACMAAFVTDLDGTGTAIGGEDTDRATGQALDMMEPGMIIPLPTGKQVTVANPPQASDHQSFSATSLRGVAAGLGTTYEDLTGDYSQVNYSSARMARIAHTADVHDWRWNMMIPLFCAPVWAWMLDAMIRDGEDVEELTATWTPPPLPMLDPGKESEATTKAVRSGQMTHDEMVREQGYDPDEYWLEYSDGLKRLDKYGIVLDCDPRKTTAQGQLQAAPSATAPKSAPPKKKPADDSQGEQPDDPADDPPDDPPDDPQDT